jgi:putative hydrolase of the HAD superfamily
MTFPKMIIFDFGHTLVYEKESDTLRGERELFRYITKNPNNLTPEEVHAVSDKLFGELFSCRNLSFELHERQFQRLLYESLGIEFSISYDVMEKIFWDTMSPGQPMPGADRMLALLDSLGIRYGVISNTMFSAGAMAHRLDTILPGFRFEFIITSSEYGVRKPNRALFDVALYKAGLKAGEVWFCGDNPAADVQGAAGAGIFPVWYSSRLECHYRDRSKEKEPVCEHLKISEWDELTDILNELK